MKEIAAIDTMSSLEVAELTGKEHFNVLNDIRAIIGQLKKTEEIGALKFQESYYVSAQNKKQPQFLLCKQSSLLVVSGYSLILRKRIIDRWQELEALQKPALPEDYLSALKALVTSEEEKLKLKAERDHITTLFDQELSFCSIIRAATYLGVHEKVFDWRVLKPWSLKNGFEVKRVPSPRYGYQVLYPIKAFMECYPQYDFSKIEPDKTHNKSSLAITHCIKLERLL